MHFIKLFLFSLIFFWSCATVPPKPKVAPEVLLSYCDKVFICIGSRIEEYKIKASTDLEILKTTARLAEFVCDEDAVKVKLIIDLKMLLAKQPKEQNCVDTIVNIQGTVKYIEDLDQCEIGIVTSQFEKFEFCKDFRSL